ncbi:CD1247 N-terminal domain-containing protein [Clostridioides difficile]
MRDIYTKINEVKNKIDNLDIKDEQYRDIFNSFSDILLDLSSKVEDVTLRQEYLEENMEYIDNDLTDIQDELFEEVSFDDLNSIEDEYVEIKCKKCNKPLFVEQEALNNNTSIPCPFCGGKAKE